MAIRPFRPEDAPALAELSASCARGESDFVLNPLWETPEELFAEFDRFGIDPEAHLLVADAGDGEVQGMVGYLRHPGADVAGMFCPIVRRDDRGRGLGGKLLRAALDLGASRLSIKLASAGIGTRNRLGYSLLTAHGFRPVRQTYMMRCDEEPVAPPPLSGVVREPARPEDADAILAIYTSCGFPERSADGMRRALGDGRHSHAVARQAGRVVAFTEFETHWPRRVWVAFVGVTPELRERGLGSGLVAWALQRHFAEGAQEALLMLSPANRQALRAYEKVGLRRHRLVDLLEKGL